MADAILVTGATGLIGTSLVRQLRAAGHRVVTLSTADGDISEAMQSVPPVRHVFHLAAKTFVPDSWAHPAEFYRVNVMGAVNVLDYCRRERAGFALVSSYVYANPPQPFLKRDRRFPS